MTWNRISRRGAIAPCLHPGTHQNLQNSGPGRLGILVFGAVLLWSASGLQAADPGTPSFLQPPGASGISTVLDDLERKNESGEFTDADLERIARRFSGPSVRSRDSSPSTAGSPLKEPEQTSRRNARRAPALLPDAAQRTHEKASKASAATPARPATGPKVKATELVDVTKLLDELEQKSEGGRLTDADLERLARRLGTTARTPEPARARHVEYQPSAGSRAGSVATSIFKRISSFRLLRRQESDSENETAPSPQENAAAEPETPAALPASGTCGACRTGDSDKCRARGKCGAADCGPDKLAAGCGPDKSTKDCPELPAAGCTKPPSYEVDPTQPSELAPSDEPAGLVNPFVDSFTVGEGGTSPSVIGDLLKSGGQVRVNFRPQSQFPGGVDVVPVPGGGFTAPLLLDRANNRIVYTSGGLPTDPTTLQPFIFFQAPNGEGLDDFGFNDLQRVTLDGSGGITIEDDFDLIVNSMAGGTVTFTSARQDLAVTTPANAAAANTGIVKAAEGASPIPRDRVFFFYSLFDNVPLGQTGGITIHRYTPGFEKTFFNGTTSFEARFPMASTLDSEFNFTEGFINDTAQTEFGDILFTLKSVLYQGEDWILSGGVQASIPTADDLQFFYTDTIAVNNGGMIQNVSQTAEFLRIENESPHVLPFLAALWTPSPEWFIQAFAQFDFDTSGKPVLVNRTPLSGGAFETVGMINDPLFLYADLSIGYWLRRELPGSTSTITGIAPIVELHYNRTLTETDDVTFGDFAQVGRGGEHIEILNATVGLSFELRHQTYMTFGFATPIAGGSDTEFDGELRVLLSHRFGGGQQ